MGTLLTKLEDIKADPNFQRDADNMKDIEEEMQRLYVGRCATLYVTADLNAVSASTKEQLEDHKYYLILKEQYLS